MLNINTIGQYIPGNSLIHHLDPRTKFLSLLVAVILVFLLDKLIPLGILVAVIIALTFVAGIKPKMFWQALRPIVFILIFALILQLFFTPGEKVAAIGPLAITREGLINSGVVFLRLIAMLLSAYLLTATTSPSELTYGLEKLLKPFGKIGVPYGEIALMLTIALRFIPTLTAEAERLIKVQESRGVDFNARGLANKARIMLPLIVPLFINAFKRADELAVAMEARGYRIGAPRGKLKPLRYSRIDYFILLTDILLAAILLILKRWGGLPA
ncbi:energy-coupling factor transporter transmembrane component T family protein [Carboxydothermus pertinax]|uniref:Cobalt ABC transporter permease n=1 Tax=Carboxydothermus pertinax TaxID=870242 RepID=A0A1L8CY46_9THEO|nr:energy-coupling factor transporter transmembrane component T [Carboxydothermus pertinax]GAV23852.1 cobalt ABC transporter permease [Carboxydothermus pertinax]